MSQTQIAIITCPVCKATNLSTALKGVIFKKTVYKCLSCGSELESGDGLTFMVTDVGAEFSNAQSLLEGKHLKLAELATHKLPVLKDAQLAQFAEGAIPPTIFHHVGQGDTAIILRKNELVAFHMSNVQLCEERRQRVSAGGGSFSFRVARGAWYHTSRLSEPQYADRIQALDTGTLTITSLRYVFVGSNKSIDQPLTKLTSVTPYRDGIGVSRVNKQKVEYFKGAYHWPIVASILLGIAKNTTLAG